MKERYAGMFKKFLISQNFIIKGSLDFMVLNKSTDVAVCYIRYN